MSKLESTKVSRRAMLAGTSVAAIAVTSPVAALPLSTDPHIAWESELFSLRAAERTAFDAMENAVIPDDSLDAAHEAAMDAVAELESRFSAAPAHTVAGLEAMARELRFRAKLQGGQDLPSPSDVTLALNIADTATRMLAGAA